MFALSVVLDNFKFKTSATVNNRDQNLSIGHPDKHPQFQSPQYNPDEQRQIWEIFTNSHAFVENFYSA